MHIMLDIPCHNIRLQTHDHYIESHLDGILLKFHYFNALLMTSSMQMWCEYFKASLNVDAMKRNLSNTHTYVLVYVYMHTHLEVGTLD